MYSNYQSMKPKPKKSTKSEVIFEEYLKTAGATKKREEEKSMVQINTPIFFFISFFLFLFLYLTESLLSFSQEFVIHTHTIQNGQKGTEIEIYRERKVNIERERQRPKWRRKLENGVCEV